MSWGGQQANIADVIIGMFMVILFSWMETLLMTRDHDGQDLSLIHI